MRKINVNRNYYRLVMMLLLSWSFSILSAQNVTVKGVVSDDGGTIPGVTVQVKGQSGGTITDIDGNYSIDVVKGQVLIFSFVGMETQEITYAGQMPLDVKMSSGAIALESVVVVGFGKQKKKSVVGSIVQATSEEIMQAGSVSSVSQALAGILPGVTVMQDAGMPGATEANILIRGQSSWTGNSPLYMVDGVERDFNQIDPNEIASISVLKDASATAVYGLKAANGVILVTTKSGSAKKTQVNVSTNWGMKVPTVNYDHMTEYADVLRYYNVGAVNENKYSSLTTQNKIDTWADPNRDRDYYTYLFLSDYMFDKGFTQQYNINVSGGNDFVKYFTSLGYHYDGDMFDVDEQAEFDPRTSQKRYNWRSNLDFNFTKTTKVSVKLSGDFRDWNGNEVTNSTPTGTEWTQPLRAIFNEPIIGTPPVLSDGRLGIPQGASGESTTYGKLTREGQYSKRSNRVYSDFMLSQGITKYLDFTAKLSLNYSRQYNSNVWLNEIYFYSDPVSHEIVQNGDRDANATYPLQSAESISQYNQTLYYDFRLNYNRTFNDAHDVGLLALFSRREENKKLEYARREESWVGRATYAYKSKYMFEFNGAYNGNENWAPGLKFGFFPSGALGWNVTEESFMKNHVSFIDYMKVKYSYGLVGSDSGIGDDRFTYRQVFYERGNAYWGYGPAARSYGPTFSEGKPANPSNTWEEAVKQNIGFEMRFLDGHLSTEIDLFDEKRTGILMQRRTIPPMYGNDAPYANLGETKNHGFDISMRYNNTITDDLSYFITANLSMSENRVVFRDDPVHTDDYRKSEGKPIGYQTGRVTTGFLNNWDDVYNSTSPANSGDVVMPGDFGFVDYNNDGYIDSNDAIPIMSPNYAANSYAFSLGLEYKSFSLHAMFNGVFNIAKTISTNFLYSNNVANNVVNGHEIDYWTPYNTDATGISPRLTIGQYQKAMSDYAVRNSSFLRLRNVELKYKASKAMKERLKYIKNLELFVNGQNLLTITDLPKAFDPESKVLESYPISRTYNAGLRVSF